MRIHFCEKMVSDYPHPLFTKLHDFHQATFFTFLTKSLQAFRWELCGLVRLDSSEVTFLCETCEGLIHHRKI